MKEALGCAFGDGDRTTAGWRSERVAYREVLAGFLRSRFKISHFISLTFASIREPWDRLGYGGAALEAARSAYFVFWRRVSRAAYKRIDSVTVYARGSVNRRVHVHALLAGAESVPVKIISRQWRHGNSDVRIYDPARGAIPYVVRHIDAEFSNWEIL